MAKYMGSKDWDIQIHGRRVEKSREMNVRLCASPRLGRWWVLLLDNGVSLYARPESYTSARTLGGELRSKRVPFGQMGKSPEGKRVTHVEKVQLRVSACARAYFWWVCTLDDGKRVYARPVELTTARTSKGTILSDVNACVN